MANNDEGSCFDLLKSACNPKESMSIAERGFLGFIGLVGSVTVDPVTKIMKALNVKDDNPSRDPDDPLSPGNQNF